MIKTQTNSLSEEPKKAPPVKRKPSLAAAVQRLCATPTEDRDLPPPLVFIGFVRRPHGDTKGQQQVIVATEAGERVEYLLWPWEAIVRGLPTPEMVALTAEQCWRDYRDPKSMRELLKRVRELVSSEVVVLTADGLHRIVDPKGNVFEVWVAGKQHRVTVGTRSMLTAVDPTKNMPMISGSLEQWNTKVGVHLAGNPRLLVTVLATLALPLASLTGGQPPALLISGTSSTGKTTVLRVAQSVITSNGVIDTMSGTKLGIREHTERNAGLPTIIDEVNNADDPASMVDLVFGVEGRTTRRRSTHGSPAGAAVSMALDTALIMANEHGLADLMQNHARQGTMGPWARIVEVSPGTSHGMFNTLPQDIDAGTFAKRLTQAAPENGGTLWQAWIKELGNRVGAQRERWKERLVELQAELGARLEANHNVARRLAESCAVWVLAGEIASASGLLPIKESAAANAVTYVLKRHCARLVAGEPDRQLILPVVAAISAMSRSLKDWPTMCGSGVVDNAWKEDHGKRHIVILPPKLNAVLGTGERRKRTLAALVKAALLVKPSKGYATQLTLSATKRRHRFYVFDDAILSYEN